MAVKARDALFFVFTYDLRKRKKVSGEGTSAPKSIPVIGVAW
jgi:hypothetical protein